MTVEPASLAATARLSRCSRLAGLGASRGAIPVLATMMLAGCGGTGVAASRRIADAQGNSTGHSPRYATSVTSPGVVNPSAIPLGDGHVSTSPKVGFVDSCVTSFGGGGAEAQGSWIDAKRRTWDSSRKIAVRGSVRWPSAYYKVSSERGRRVIEFDDLPIDHTTGIFPISASDPAYAYDHNPNQIAAQRLHWILPLHPKAAHRPSCTPGGPIGVLNDGVALFNALDGLGRDAAAHEVLDGYHGHPDPSGSYHHHAIPTGIVEQAPKGRATLVGYALDGYGIYVEKNAQGILPGNRALDACHGKTSDVPWDGKMTRVYHYVATLEYPYTIGCFHGIPVNSGDGQGQGGPPVPAGGPPVPGRP